MSNNPAKYEVPVLIKQYLCSILDVSAFMDKKYGGKMTS